MYSYTVIVHFQYTLRMHIQHKVIVHVHYTIIVHVQYTVIVHIQYENCRQNYKFRQNYKYRQNYNKYVCILVGPLKFEATIVDKITNVPMCLTKQCGNFISIPYYSKKISQIKDMKIPYPPKRRGNQYPFPYRVNSIPQCSFVYNFFFFL